MKIQQQIHFNNSDHVGVSLLWAERGQEGVKREFKKCCKMRQTGNMSACLLVHSLLLALSKLSVLSTTQGVIQEI